MSDKHFETHMFTYRHDGAEWAFMVKATDSDDARRRVGAMAHASYDGVVHSTSSAYAAQLGIVGCWLANFWQAMRRLMG
jgi:hypothetical protein